MLSSLKNIFHKEGSGLVSLSSRPKLTSSASLALPSCGRLTRVFSTSPKVLMNDNDNGEGSSSNPNPGRWKGKEKVVYSSYLDETTQKTRVTEENRGSNESIQSNRSNDSNLSSQGKTGISSKYTVTEEVKELSETATVYNNTVADNSRSVSRHIEGFIEDREWNLSPEVIEKLMKTKDSYSQVREEESKKFDINKTNSERQFNSNMRRSECNEKAEIIEILLNAPLPEADKKEIRGYRDDNDEVREDNKNLDAIENHLYRAIAKSMGLENEHKDVDTSVTEDYANPINEMPSHTEDWD